MLVSWDFLKRRINLRTNNRNQDKILFLFPRVLQASSPEANQANAADTRGVLYEVRLYGSFTKPRCRCTAQAAPAAEATVWLKATAAVPGGALITAA